MDGWMSCSADANTTTSHCLSTTKSNADQLDNSTRLASTRLKVDELLYLTHG